MRTCGSIAQEADVVEVQELKATNDTLQQEQRIDPTTPAGISLG